MLRERVSPDVVEDTRASGELALSKLIILDDADPLCETMPRLEETEELKAPPGTGKNRPLSTPLDVGRN